MRSSAASIMLLCSITRSCEIGTRIIIMGDYENIDTKLRYSRNATTAITMSICVDSMKNSHNIKTKILD